MRGNWNKIMLLLLMGVSGIHHAQDSTAPEMIGDNLNLSAVLDAFKTAKTLENFEKEINVLDSKINNLDLNEDGAVDYIRVIDNTEDKTHAFILRVDISESDAQDVAVILLEKTGTENAIIQIVGDKDLYGKDYLIEPTETAVMGYAPPSLIIVNVWNWPTVRFVYSPTYRPWRSPWSWRKYPDWWAPRKPYRWDTYRGFHNYHNHYRLVHTHHVGNAHKIYYNNRRSWQHIHQHPHNHLNQTPRKQGNGSQNKTKGQKRSKGNKPQQQ